MARSKGNDQAAAIGVIIGGGLGNVVDRLRHGGVTDFLDFHYNDNQWPAFHLADTAIFLGVVFFLIRSNSGSRL